VSGTGARAGHLAIALLVSLSAAAGCKPGERAPAPEGRAKPVTIAVSPYFSNAPLFIAQEEGYFIEEGLAVTLQPPPVNTTSEVVPALAQGRIDAIAGGLTIGMLNAMSLGAHIRFVADKGRYAVDGCSSAAMVAGRRLLELGEVSSPADLKGRRLGGSNSSVSQYFVDALLDSLSLRPEDVTRSALPPAATLDALENGAVDFVLALEPWLTHLRQAGHGVLVPYERIIPDFQFAIIAFGPTLLERDRDAGSRFVRAYLRGVRQYNQGKTARNVEILARATKMDRSTLESLCWPSIRDDGTIAVGSVLRLQEWARRKGLMDRALAESAFWDGSFVRAAAGGRGDARAAGVGSGVP
jgi:NitT/TauT family transport system substrate-binding protein